MASRFALLAIEDDDSPAPAPAPVAKKSEAAAPTADKSARKPREQGTRAPAARKTLNESAGDSTPAGAEAVRDDRASGRGRGSGRGQRGARGSGRGGRGGKFDRHSNTGHTDSHKKEVQGWGGDDGVRELNAEKSGDADAAAEKGWATDSPAPASGADDWDTGVAGETPVKANGDAAAATAATDDAGPPKTEWKDVEDNTKSYADYLAEKAAAAPALPSLSVRKANEGVDDSQWKDGVPLAKKGVKDDDDTLYVGKGESKARQRKAKEGKTFIDVDFSFAPPSSGERGGRGRGRGGRGDGFRGGRGARGAGRGARGGFSGPRSGGQTQSVQLDDSSAFPSLA